MKKYIFAFVGSFILFMGIAMGMVAYIDPFFHYHEPVKSLYYTLTEERYQNDGMARFFDYDSIITGPSLVEHIKTSVFDEEFDTNAAKLPFSGATFYETANVLEAAYDSGHDLKLVYRTFDMNHLVEEPHADRIDLGTYPEYLYNDSLLDDYKYLCNLDVIHEQCMPIICKRIRGVEGGVTSFDDYMYVDTAPGNVLGDISHFGFSDESVDFTPEDKRILTANMEKNVIALAKEHPETTFIYFIPPYSVAWWNGYAARGEYDYITTAMRYAAGMVVGVDNIKLYMFANDFDVTTDLSNYVDAIHYVNEINYYMMDEIKAGKKLLTADNYEQQFDIMYDFYKNYNYEMLEKQAQQQ